MEGMAIGHNFGRDRPRDHPCQVWFNLVERFQRRKFKCDLFIKICQVKRAITPKWVMGFTSKLQDR
jgi:hypothetical protein